MGKNDDTIIIKKYTNRRLYNTATSSYVTLDNLVELVREEKEFVVRDAKTGADLTHSILTQISTGELPVPNRQIFVSCRITLEQDHLKWNYLRRRVSA